jgi:hypothetical protein
LGRKGIPAKMDYYSTSLLMMTSMAVIYAMVSVGNLANRNKYWQEAVEELSFRIDEKNGLTSNAEFIMSSLLYHSIYFKAWS